MEDLVAILSNCEGNPEFERTNEEDLMCSVGKKRLSVPVSISSVGRERKRNKEEGRRQRGGRKQASA